MNRIFERKPKPVFIKMKSLVEEARSIGYNNEKTMTESSANPLFS